MVGNKKYPPIASLVKKYKPFYKALGKVSCKALGGGVNFSNIGWKHIRFDGHKHKRLPSNIAMRLHLLPFIPKVIKQANSYIKEEGVLKNGNKIIFYELAESVEVNGKKKNVTVVVTEVVGGEKHYYSARYTRFKKKNP